jgi:hypothetical protein
MSKETIPRRNSSIRICLPTWPPTEYVVTMLMELKGQEKALHFAQSIKNLIWKEIRRPFSKRVGEEKRPGANSGPFAISINSSN